MSKSFLIYGCLIGSLVFFLLPIIWVFILSFQSDNWSTPVLTVAGFPIPFHHYQTLFANKPVWHYFLNTLTVVIGSTALSLGLGIPAAFALARSSHWLVQTVGMSLWIFRLIPPFALWIPMYVGMRDLNLLDTYLGMIVLQTALKLSFTVWLLQGFFAALSPDLEAAACVDGCTLWGSFWRIALPLVMPGVGMVGGVGAIFSWNDLFVPLLVSGVHTRPLSLGILESVGSYTINWGEMSAFAMISSIPIFLGALCLDLSLFSKSNFSKSNQ
ncbi:MAG: carbohydrate ABC transporter permease [Cyanobacteriota bacterium]|nr:carbohydrate ABC transporter permease [Cyanobacteriota bacterium]